MLTGICLLKVVDILLKVVDIDVFLNTPLHGTRALRFRLILFQLCLILFQCICSKHRSNFVPILFHIWEKIGCGCARKLRHVFLPDGGKRENKGGKEGPTITRKGAKMQL